MVRHHDEGVKFHFGKTPLQPIPSRTDGLARRGKLAPAIHDLAKENHTAIGAGGDEVQATGRIIKSLPANGSAVVQGGVECHCIPGELGCYPQRNIPIVGALLAAPPFPLACRGGAASSAPTIAARHPQCVSRKSRMRPATPPACRCAERRSRPGASSPRWPRRIRSTPRSPPRRFRLRGNDLRR